MRTLADSCTAKNFAASNNSQCASQSHAQGRRFCTERCSNLLLDCSCRSCNPQMLNCCRCQLPSCCWGPRVTARGAGAAKGLRPAAASHRSATACAAALHCSPGVLPQHTAGAPGCCPVVPAPCKALSTLPPPPACYYPSSCWLFPNTSSLLTRKNPKQPDMQL